jgi:glycosyltransferase involved in cell wall biosynthesis
MNNRHDFNINDFKRHITTDIGDTLCPVIFVTRRPDGTGLYQHYKGIVSALEGSVPIKTLFLGENANLNSIRTLAWDIGASSVIFCESFNHLISPSELKQLKDEVSLKVGLILAWDSTQLDPCDVNCIDKCVDVVFPVCAEFAEVWRNQLAQNVLVKYLREPLSHGAYETLAPIRQRKCRDNDITTVNILSVASYHPRKNHDLAIDAVKQLLDSGISCKLRIHSNLDQGEFLKIKSRGELLLGDHFLATRGELTSNELLNIYKDSDIFLSCSQGEGCNIGLRAAMSSGMPVVFTNIPGHRDLLDFRIGTFPVDANEKVPGIYPERSEQSFGYQMKADPKNIASAIINSITYAASNNYNPLDISKQIYIQDERRSKLYLWDLFASTNILCTHQRLGVRRSGQLDGFSDVLVVPSLDAGFFSIVNTYLSHKLFWEYPGLYNRVVPAWSPEMVSMATGKSFDKFTSYCYSKLEDGNAFEHLFGNPDAAFSVDLDYRECTFAGTSPNAKVDPNLTYIHSEKLYKSALFMTWRKEMSHICWNNLCLQPKIVFEATDNLKQIRQYDHTLAMHVRHPSHAMEQRDKSIALVEDYIRVAEGWFSNIPDGESSAIVLATDQEEVVLEFEMKFPGQVIYRKNVSRVSTDNTVKEKTISSDEKLKEGRQIQHLMASSIAGWNLKNAKDVLSDALLLSMADSLIHVNSNIATIVSVFNPEIKMYHIRGGDDYNSLDARSLILSTFSLY